MAKLMGYYFKVLYKKGSKNIVADALSGRPIISVISVVQSKLWEKIQKSSSEDPELAMLITQLQQNQFTRKHYHWEQGEMKRKNKIVVGKDKLVRQLIL